LRSFADMAVANEFAATLAAMKREASDAERRAVAELRRLVPGPAAEPFSDADYLRFLRARGGDVTKARTFLEEHLEWRAHTRPAHITRERVDRVLTSGVCRLTGVTLERTGVLWFRVDMWDPSSYDVNAWLQFIAFLAERTTASADRFITIFDMDGWRLSHAMHLGKIHGMISVLQNHYPERLEAALLLRAPTIFDAAWRLIRPVIDPVTASKVFFVRRADEAQTLPSFVAPEVLPDIFGGGKLPAASIPFPNLPGVENVGVVAASKGTAAALANDVAQTGGEGEGGTEMSHDPASNARSGSLRGSGGSEASSWVSCASQ